MTPKQFEREMNKIVRRYSGERKDTESAHIDADDLICEVLRKLGYGKGIEIFVKMDKSF